MPKKTNILGLSFYYHDSAACLVQDGKIIAAAQEERFTRKKHDESFPQNSIEFCLKQAGIKAPDLDYVVFYEKPFLKFERLLETYLAYAPKGFFSFIKAIPIWIKKKLWIRSLIQDELEINCPILFAEHHESHAASAFFPSPYDRAAFLTTDGVGEWTTTSYGVGDGNSLKIMAEQKFPHSLGLLYSAFTYYCGFKVNSGEYKFMGLAPYGEPKYKNLILKELVDIKPDGSFRLNMDYFNYAAGLTMTSQRFHRLFGAPPRKPESKLESKHMDIAASAQAVTEEIVLAMARYVKQQTGEKYLCLAGGVSLNCVVNGTLLRSGLFEDIWIQPAAGDAGGALGAALTVWYRLLKKDRAPQLNSDSMAGAFLGPSFTNTEIEEFLKLEQIPYEALNGVEVEKKTAELIRDGYVVGWFHGRMEFGPRALGARSILGDARKPGMQKRMNVKIKFRESFRPFAPSILEERNQDFFELDRKSPYMLLVADVVSSRRKDDGTTTMQNPGLERVNEIRSDIPAVTHVDYSARIQTVDYQTNPKYYNLLKVFEALTGYPVIINTSFNVRGEPLVCTPQDAYSCFMRTEMDYLVIGDFLLDKLNQPKSKKPKEIWQKEFELD